MAPLVENSSDVTAAPRYRSAIGPRSSSTSTRIRGRSMLALAAAAVGNQLPAISAFIPTAPSPSCPASAASTTAALVRSNRERERRELVELNDRFANYVERVRFLEAQNKKLKLEVDGLRRQIDGANGHSRLKEMYETELNEARALVDQTARQKNEVELRSRKLEDEASDLRDQLESLHLVRSGERKTLEGLSRQIADNEAELGLVHRRLKDTDEEYKRQRSETQKLSAQIQATMSELYQETALKLELQNEKQSLEEEISFLRQIHAQELEEILANNAAASSEVIDPSLFFKHELANAIRDIRSEYEALNQQQRQEIENWYRLKVAEIVNESRRPAESSIGRLRDEEELRQLREQVTVSKKDAGNLRIRNRDLQTRIQELEQVVDQERRQGDRERELRDRELDELRSRFEQVLAEYDELVSSKTTLDSEIAIYRKLLEGEEHRNQEPPFESVVEPSAAAEPRPPAASSSSSSGIGSDLRIGLDRARTSESAIGLDLSSSSSTTSLGHGSPCSVQSRTAFKRSAKGPISLTECSKHGHFISISNASYKKTKDLNGWYVTQQSSQGSEIKFVFDKSVKIEPNKKIKLFSEKAVLEEMVVVVREKDQQQQDDSFVICAGIPNWLTEEDQVVTKLYDSEDQEKASYTQTRSSSSQ